VSKEIKSESINREFGTDTDVERITGRKRRTLQKDRFFGRGFPFYRVGRKIVYDLNEIRRIVRAGRVEPSPDYLHAISDIALHSAESPDPAEAESAAAVLVQDAPRGLKAGPRPPHDSDEVAR
jgi:hypothetical protein